MTHRVIPFLVALGSLPARAAEPVRVAVLAPVSPGNDARRLASLGDIVAVEMARDDAVQVISAADIANMVGFERQKQLLGCDETQSACLAEIGGALGVEYIVSTQVGRIGSTTVLSLSLISAGRARPLHRFAVELDSEDRLVAEARRGAAELRVKLLRVVGAPAPAIAAAPPAARPEQAAPPAERTAPSPASRRGRLDAAPVAEGPGAGAGRIVGWTACAAGLVGGAVLVGTGWATKSAYDDGVRSGVATVSWTSAQNARLRAGIGSGLAGVSIAGAVLLLVLGTSSSSTASIDLVPRPDGAMVAVGGEISP